MAGAEDPVAAVARARAAGDAATVAMLSGSLAVGLQEEGRYDEAVEWYGHAIDAFLQLGDMEGVGIHLFNLGVVGVLTQRAEWAGHYFSEAVSVLREAGTDDELATALESLSSWQMNEGQPREAIPTILELLSIRRRTGPPEALQLILELLGQQQELADDHEAALRTAEEMLQLAGASSIEEAIATFRLGLARRNAGDLAGARASYQRARELYGALHHDAEARATTVKLGEAMVEDGDPAGAISELECVLPAVRDAADPDELNVCLVRLAEAQTAVGSHGPAVALFDEAAQVRRSIGDAASAAYLLLAAADAAIAAHDHEGAITRARATIDINPRDGVVKAMACGRLVEAYGALDKALELESSLHEGLAAARSVGDHHQEALLLRNRAAFARRRGRLHEAVEYYEQALEPARAAKDARVVVETLLQLAVALVYVLADARAEPLLEEALASARELRAADLEAAALSNLGRLEDVGRSARERLRLLELAVEKFRSLGDDAGAAGALLHSGVVHRTNGDYDAALTDLHEALALARRASARGHEAQILGAMGVTQRYLGDFGSALDLHRQALELERASGDEVAIQQSLAWMGTVYLTLGEMSDALGYFGHALARAERLGIRDDDSELFNKAGLALSGIGRHADAAVALEKGLEIARARADRSQEATLLNNLGFLYGVLDDGPDRAIEALRSSVELAEGQGLRPLEGKARNQLAAMLRSTGESAEALAQICTALQIARGTGILDDEIAALTNLGGLREEAGAVDEAIESYREAVAVLERIRSAPADREVRELVLGNSIGVYQNLVFALIGVGATADAFDSAEASKARGTLDMLGEAVSRIRRGVDPELIAEEKRLHGEIFTLRRRTRATSFDGEVARELQMLEERLAGVAGDIRRSSPAFADLKYVQTLRVEDVRRDVLTPSEVLIEYVFDETRLAAFVVGRDRASTHRFADGSQTIERVREHVLSLRDPSADSYDAGLARELHERLIAPIEESISLAAGDAPAALVIVPDGILHYLPFESLVTSRTGPRLEYLVERYEVAYAPSASVIAAARRPRARGRPVRDVVALAPFAASARVRTSGAGAPLRSPELQDLADDPPSLPGSALELEEIATAFPGTLCLKDDDATQAAFEAASRGSRYLHLATHGYLDSERPAYSGLLLAGDVLQTHELFNLELDADLVVLSACETGLGRMRNGEGLVGLTRAFLFAGATSLVVSLWRVGDASSAAMIGHMYRRLSEGAGPRRALSEAKRWMLHRPAEVDAFGYELRHDHPFHWAPFVLVGAGE